MTTQRKVNLKKQYQVSHYYTFPASFNISKKDKLKKASLPPPKKKKKEEQREKTEKAQDWSNKQM